MSDMDKNNVLNSTTENNTVENPSVSTVMEPELVVGAERKTFNKTKFFAIVIAAVLIICGCSALVYAFVPQVKNTVKMLINSPEEYYLWVEEENLDGVKKSINEYIDKISDKDKFNVNSSFDINLESEAIQNAVADNLGTDIKIPSNIRFVEKGTKTDDNIAVNTALSFDNNDFLSCNLYMKDGKFYYQIPELSSSYICLDIASMFETAMNDAVASKGAENSEQNELANRIFSSIFNNIQNDNSNIDAGDFVEFISKYIDMLFKKVNKVELEKNYVCEVNGVKSEYTKLSAKIDEGTLYAFAKDALNELMNDEFLKKIYDFCGLNDDEINKISSTMQELCSHLEKYDISGGEELLVMNVFVDGKGVVVGRTIELNEGDSGKIAELGFLHTQDGDKSEDTLFIDSLETGKYSVDISSVEKSGAFTGTASVKADGKVISADFTDFKCDGEFIEGSVTPHLSELGLDDFTVVFERNDDQQIIKSDITYQNKKYADFVWTASTKKPESITEFNASEKVYNFHAEAYSELEGYGNEINSDYLEKKIMDIFGIDVNQSMVNDIYESADSYAVDDTDTDTDISLNQYDVSYNVDNIKIQIDGKDIKLPDNADAVIDKVKFESDKIEANGYAYGSNDDGNLFVGIENNSDKEKTINECKKNIIAISAMEGADITVDGIGIGGDIKALADKYGAVVEDTTSGYLSVNNSENFDKYSYTIYLYYENGKILGINLNYYSLV